MKPCCRGCKFEKPKGKDTLLCTKYGMIIGYSKAYCVGKQTRGNTYLTEVRKPKN